MHPAAGCRVKRCAPIVDCMWISELAERAGVAARTVRFYEEAGLLAKPERTHSGYRNYDEATVDRLGFIKSAKSLGLTLTDIGRVLELADAGERPCGRVGAMVDHKVAEIDQRIEELQVLRARLHSLDVSRDVEASVCPIIESAGDSSTKAHRKLTGRP